MKSSWVYIFFVISFLVFLTTCQEACFLGLGWWGELGKGNCCQVLLGRPSNRNRVEDLWSLSHSFSSRRLFGVSLGRESERLGTWARFQDEGKVCVSLDPFCNRRGTVYQYRMWRTPWVLPMQSPQFCSLILKLPAFILWLANSPGRDLSINCSPGQQE